MLENILVYAIGIIGIVWLVFTVYKNARSGAKWIKNKKEKDVSFRK